MKTNHQLYEHENVWVTKMGALFPGERIVFRGKDLFSELSEQRWMQVLLFGITGREFTDKQARLIEGIWVIGGSYPDPRIWNNRIASLGGTARSTVSLSISSAIAASEAKYFGQRPLIKAIDFLLDCKKHLNNERDLNQIVKDELKSNRMLSGFGRPIINKDERIVPLIKFAKSLEFGNGYFVNLVFKIEQLLQESKYKYKLNAAGLAAALAADQGLSPYEFNQLMTLCFTIGFFPCYQEALQQTEGTFFPYRCKRINYTGSNNRKW